MYLGIDMGGTFIKYALLDDEGEFVEKGKIPTITDDKDACLKSMQELYLNYKDKGIKGIAMSVPGLVDVEQGIMHTSGAITCLSGIHMAEELSALCDGVKVSVENDGKAAALAEAWKGAAKDVPNCCVLGFGTGIAGATIINKKALRGNHLIAGEMSLFPLPSDYKTVKTTGMAFKYSTATAVGRAAKALGLEHGELDGEKLMSMYREGNEIVVDICEDWFYNIAVLCYQLSLTVDPDVICIGGGISADPMFIEGIQKYVHQIFTSGFCFLEPTVVECAFRNDSNIIGALYNFKQLYE
ncbi:MAG: ROK family protein [Erysipelotrichaceae bacterium]|nr:ROK family protein [Erysipelotrichaceae bacterium]